LVPQFGEVWAFQRRPAAMPHFLGRNVGSVEFAARDGSGRRPATKRCHSQLIVPKAVVFLGNVPAIKALPR
jgi:hypothetical protein